MIAVLLAGLLVVQPTTPAPPAPDDSANGEPQLVTLVEVEDLTQHKVECDTGRKFETEAETIKGGQKHLLKITLCARPGQSDASYAAVLKSVAADLAGNKDLPEEARTRVIAALNTEIAKLSASR